MNGQARILVADDDLDMLDLFKGILTGNCFSQPTHPHNFGSDVPTSQEIIKKPDVVFEIECCEQGDEALHLAKKAVAENRPFTVTFLDMRMPPGPNGLWAAKKIRELDPHVEIVMVTGYSDYQTEEIASFVPPAHKLFYIKKPFQVREIYYLSHILYSKWKYEQNLLCLNENLEKKVDDRTKDLKKKNDLLKKEIFERKRIEHELKLSEERFRLLVENVVFGILIIQQDQVVFMGPDQGEINTSILKSFKSSYFTRQDATTIEKFYQKILTSGKSKEGLEISFFPDGKKNRETMKWVHCKGSVIEYKGSPAVMIAMVDVTKVKEMEKVMHLREKMATLGHVTAGIAHEIKSPLFGINLLLGDIRENFENPEYSDDIKLFLDEALKASNKIASTVKRILDFARPRQPQMGKSAIHVPIKEAIELSKTTLRKSNISFESHLQDNLSALYIDPLLIEQVMLNLITNASDAMTENKKEKKIKLTSWQNNSDLYISVSDSGAGITEDLKEKIFDPFFTTKPDGSGIGLSFCQQVITNHNGTIELYPSDLGGAEFRIKLPIDKRILSR